jgi:hypothetical protein
MMTPAQRKQRTQSIAQAVAASIVFAGLAAFTFGVWQAWRPAGWMVAGLLIALPSLFWLYNDVRSTKK